MTGIKQSDCELAVSKVCHPSAMMMVPALLSAALLLLVVPGTLPLKTKPLPIDVVVDNSLLGTPPLTFKTEVVSGGILLGALQRLMDSNSKFSFTYTQNPNYGPYLESVNGVAGSDQDRTYWELLVRTLDGHIIRPNVGIGCYIPSANEQIILKFTKW